MTASTSGEAGGGRDGGTEGEGEGGKAREGRRKDMEGCRPVWRLLC